MKNKERRTPQVRKRRPNRLRERWDVTLAGIIDMSRMLSYNLDAEAIWDALHDNINLSFDTTSFFVALYDYERDQLTFPVVSEGGLRTQHDPMPVCGLSRAVMLHGVEFYVGDIDAERDRLTAMNVEPDEREPGRWARSWIGVPLRSRQSEVTGLIALQNVLPQSFNDLDLSLLMAIAAPLSLALDNLRLIDTERERRLIATALMEIGQLAGAHEDYDEVLERLLDQLQRVSGYDSAAILLAEIDATDRLIVGASHDPDLFIKGSELRLADLSPLAQSLASQQPIVISDTQDFTGWWDGNLGDAPLARAWLIVPLVVRDRTSGLVLLGKMSPGAYTQKDASNAFALARQGAIALETARLQAQGELNLQMQQQRARRKRESFTGIWGSGKIGFLHKGLDLMAPMGLYYEEIEIGADMVTRGRTITEADLVQFAGLTGDYNPMHTNAEYMKNSVFGQRIAHGMLTLSYAVGQAYQLGFMEQTVIAFRGLEMKFSLPVFIGDTLHTELKVREKKEARRMGGGWVTLDVKIINQEGKTVQSGEWTMLIALKPEQTSE